MEFMTGSEEKKFYYLVIDANNLFYRVALNIKTENISQLYTDVIGNPAIAFFDRVKDLQSRFGYETSEVYLLFDNPGSVYYKRREIDSSYKHNREQTKLNSLFLAIINLIQLVALAYSDSYRTVQVTGYEADDTVRPLLEKLDLNFYQNCLLISNDLDWSRGMSDYTYWYNHKKLYDRESFAKKYGFVPSEKSVILWKALTGDASDCIEAGLKHAPKEVIHHILSTYNSVDELIAGSSNDPELNKHWKEKIKESADRLRLNAQLVGFVPFPYDLDDFIRYGKREESMMNMYFSILGREDRMNEFRPFDDFFTSPVRI